MTSKDIYPDTRHKRLVVICLDGSSAFFRRKHQRIYYSDVIKKALIKYFNIPSGVTFILLDTRSGIIFSKIRKAIKVIKEYNQDCNTLFLTGKSYGGWHIVKILNRIKKILKYKKIILMTVDACSIKKILKNTRIKPSQVDFIRNYFQTNERVLNGAVLEMKGLNLGTWIEEDLTYSIVHGDKINHWNIVDHPDIYHAVDKSIQALLMILTGQIKD